MAKSRETFSAFWTGAASHTRIPRQTLCSTARRKVVALVEKLDDAMNMPWETLWNQAILFACDVIKFYTTSTEREKMSYKLWSDPSLDNFRSFGAVGHAIQSVREN